MGTGAALPVVCGQDAGFPIVSTYSSSEIGADALSFCATQEASGVIAFGANTLLTFDGERWTSTAVDGAYALRSLDFDREGRLWVAATGDIGWFERTERQWKFQSLRPFLPPAAAPIGAVWHVFAGQNGATFVSEDRILRWTGRTFEIWSMPGTRRLPAMRVNGTIYIHYLNEGLYSLGPLGPEMFIPRETLQDAAVLWMEANGAGWLLATSKGLFLHEGGDLMPFAAEVSDILQRESLTSAVRLNDGRCAFGTFKGGIVLMRPDGTLDRIMTEADGLPTRSIKSLLVDDEGGLWATSQSHIFRIETTSASALFNQHALLPAQAYRAIAKVGTRLMVGGENGVYALSPDGRTFAPLEGVRELVHDIRASSRGLFVGMVRGAKEMRDGAVATVHSTSSDVLTIAPSRQSPDHVFLSDNRSIVAIAPDAAPRVIVGGLPDIARSIAEDDAGDLWMGTIARGVFVARPAPHGAVEALPVGGSSGLPELEGRSFVRATAEGTILVFADNGGWIKPAGEERFDAIERYPGRGIAAASDFAPDGIGWVAHTASGGLAPCIARIVVEGRRAHWQPHATPGLASIGAPRSLYVDTSSAGQPVLWVGGTRAVLRHVVADGPVARPPRPPLLHAFARRAGDDARQPVASALPYSTRSIEFEFAAPEFSRRDALRLETRLDGVDPDWVPAAPDSRRELTALRDASYTFRVRAIAETGAASEPAVFHFQVLPPWWRTTPVVALGVLALLPAGYGIVRLRFRALRRRNAELEKKVRERTEELEAASAAKTQFVANMSHDIRNPLNGIFGLALALEDTRLDRNQREMVATLRECTSYLSSLVDDVLDFASIEAGRVELRPGAFAPHELLRSVVTTLKGDTAECGALLTVEADPNVPPDLMGDAGRIQQILVNFVSNALKYAGGHIRLAVCVPADSPEEIDFSVHDEGRGISAEEQATLFTKFARLQHARDSNIAGAGLGLAACRLLADLMGGSVGVESQPGAGSRFFLRLPLTVATTPAPADLQELPNTTVLLVEDTDYNAWAASAVLAKLGLSCERARTGGDALRLFGLNRYNIVLLDRNLPDMDGTEVARRIRAMDTDGLQAILLAVTAYCTAEDRARCLESGMDAFVGKPLTPEKLRKVLLAAGRRLLAAAPMHLPQEPSAAELDLGLLTYLSDGTAKGVEAQIDRHASALADGESRIVKAWSARDFERLRTAAHDLGGYAQMVGGAALVEVTAQLRSAARGEDAAACGDLLPRLRTSVRALTEAMRHHRPASRSA